MLIHLNCIHFFVIPIVCVLYQNYQSFHSSWWNMLCINRVIYFCVLAVIWNEMAMFSERLDPKCQNYWWQQWSSSSSESDGCWQESVWHVPLQHGHWLWVCGACGCIWALPSWCRGHKCWGPQTWPGAIGVVGLVAIQWSIALHAWMTYSVVTWCMG